LKPSRSRAPDEQRGLLSKQSLNGKALHRTIPFGRLLDLALILQHPKEFATRDIDILRALLEFALATTEVRLNTLRKL
jgi:hypothetical protein